MSVKIDVGVHVFLFSRPSPSYLRHALEGPLGQLRDVPDHPRVEVGLVFGEADVEQDADVVFGF